MRTAVCQNKEVMRLYYQPAGANTGGKGCRYGSIIRI